MKMRNKLGDRLEFVTERGALLQILKELKNDPEEFDDVAKSFCEAIPVFRRFLTNNELSSKLVEIVVKLDPFSSFKNFSFYLGLFSKNSYSDAKIVLNWVRILCELKLETAFRESLNVGSEDDFAQQQFNEFISSIISLPDRISNCKAMATNSEEHEYVKNCSVIFEQKLIESVKIVLKSAHSKVGVSSCINLRTIAFLIAKGRNLRIENFTLLEKIVTWICSQDSENDMKWDRVAQRIFTDESYGSREYEALVTSLVLNSENVKELERCFGPAINSSEVLKRVVLVKLLFQHVLEPKVLKNVLDYVGECGNEEALPKLLENAIKIWSNTAFVRTSTIERHKHATRLILYILYLVRSNNSESKFNWQTVFLSVSDGVQARLSNTDLQVRQTGMFVGEAISKYNEIQMRKKNQLIESEEEKKKYLNFDYQEDDWIVEMRGILENGISINDQLPTTSKVDIEVKIAPKIEIPENLDQKIELDSDDDEDFPVYEVPQEERNFEKLEENEEPLRKCDPPRYIHDAFEQLLEKEKYEIFETSLLTMESLIRRNAIGFTAIAPTLATRLVFLDDRFSTPDFENIRKRCVVACLVVRPEIVPNIVQLMLGSDCSMSHRFLILECIRSAAKELGQPTELIRDSKKPPESSGNQKISTGNWKDIVEARIKSNTRRFAKEAKEVIFVENRLGKVVHQFFYPLLVQSTGEHLELLGRDSALMSKIIFTLADILHNAGLSPKLPDMAVNLIRYVSPHRYSEDQYVRIAVTFAYCSVVDLVPVTLLESYFDASSIAEWARWASQVSENDDANEHERKLAQCLLTELWKKIDSDSK